MGGRDGVEKRGRGGQEEGEEETLRREGSKKNEVVRHFVDCGRLHTDVILPFP